MHLNKEKISTALGEYQDTIDIKIYEETASTNKLAKETEYSRNTLFIAQRQSAGRGRLGRSFISPDGGLYMSLALHTNIPMKKLVMITPMAAVAVCRAIKKLTTTSPKIKWVNDIFISNKKVCGILTETFLQNDILTAVVGIGINIITPSNGFDKEIQNIAGAIFENRKDIPSNFINQLAANITREILELYNNLPSCDFVQEYRDLCFVIGKDITVVSGDTRTPAHAFAVDENCRLGVRYQDGREEFLFGGEISIRF